MPNIPLWPRDTHGQIDVKRDAEFWHKAKPGTIECTLCYRHCVLKRGETGWCGYRKNERGKMVIPHHGVLASLVRSQNGYGYDVLQTYKPGALNCDVGLTRCTARCVFCVSGNQVWQPDKLPWAYGERQVGLTGGWHAHRAMAHPIAVIDIAQRWGCTEVEFEVNEPLLSWEYTYDTARLAKRAGMDVVIFTNGFSSVDAIRKLAPFVDCVYFGIKGCGDPDFYDRWMKAPGSVPHVYASLRTWHATGVRVLIGDVLAPPHMQSDNAQQEAQARLLDTIVETLGPLAIYQPMLMIKPCATKATHGDGLMRPAGATEAFEQRIWERRAHAIERGQAAGLPYTIDNYKLLRCHACSGVLLHFHADERHTQHVTDGHCDHCGTTVPIVVLSPDELIRARGVVQANAGHLLTEGIATLA